MIKLHIIIYMLLNNEFNIFLFVERATKLILLGNIITTLSKITAN